MSMLFTWQSDGMGRSIDITVSNAISEGPNGVGAVRRLQEWFVHGVSGLQTEFKLTLPVVGEQTTFRGTHYRLPDHIIVWYVDDPNSEHNSDLVDEAGSNVEYEFTPVVL